MSEYNAPGQPPYGQQPYGAPPYGGGPVADHPQSTLVLILGILGLVACGVVAPFAWVMGNRVVREIDASQGRMGGRGAAQAGRICGIIGSVLLILSVLILIAVIGLFAVGTASISTALATW